jgi:hypothetical protein
MRDPTDIHRIGIDRSERPIADFHRPTAMLRRGPPIRTFAATQNQLMAEFTLCGLSGPSLQLVQSPLAALRNISIFSASVVDG